MSTREIVEGFWTAMRANDSHGAAEHFIENIAVVWPCGGEQIVEQVEYWPKSAWS
jgi:hypothetical protein